MISTSLPSQIARTRRFTLGVPDQFTVAPDGAVVLFLRSRAGDDPVTCLWALDVGTGTERLLADPADLAGPGALGRGIAGYATDAAARLAAFALDGALWAVDVAGGRARCLLPTARWPTRAPTRTDGGSPTPAAARCG